MLLHILALVSSAAVNIFVQVFVRTAVLLFLFYLDHFFRHLLAIYLLGKSVYSSPLPILKLDCWFFFFIELGEFLCILDARLLLDICFFFPIECVLFFF